jgi:hypothetical protein
MGVAVSPIAAMPNKAAAGDGGQLTASTAARRA